MPTQSIVQVTIPAGQSLSTIADLKTLTLTGLFLPTDWDEAQLTMQVSPDGVTWFDVYWPGAGTGTELVAYNVTAKTFLVFGPEWELCIPFVRMRSGTRQMPLPQSGNRMFQLVCYGG